MKRNLSFCLVAMLAVRVCSAQTISCDYFGQSPPGDTAVILPPASSLFPIAWKLESPSRLTQASASSPCGEQVLECQYLLHKA